MKPLILFVKSFCLSYFDVHYWTIELQVDSRNPFMWSLALHWLLPYKHLSFQPCQYCYWQVRSRFYTLWWKYLNHRFQAVCNSLLYSQRSSNQARLSISLAWTTGLVLALPILAADVDADLCFLKMEWAPWLVAYLPIVCFFLPLGIISVIYILIFYKIKRRKRTKDRRNHVSVTWSSR